MNLQFQRFLERSRASQTHEELFSAYAGFLESCGFNRVAYAIISDHSELQLGNPLGLIGSVNLDDWTGRYVERNYAAIDPMFNATYCNPGVFIWQDFCEPLHLTHEQQTFFNEAHYEAQLFNGVSLSVHGPNGSKGAILACNDSRKNTIDPKSYDLVNLASYQYHTCYLDLMQFGSGDISPLSIREAKVLQWAAIGLTKAEIGLRMNISDHTVDYHIRNIMRKLNAKNTTAALVTAIKKGFITP